MMVSLNCTRSYGLRPTVAFWWHFGGFLTRMHKKPLVQDQGQVKDSPVHACGDISVSGRERNRSAFELGILNDLCLTYRESVWIVEHATTLRSIPQCWGLGVFDRETTLLGAVLSLKLLALFLIFLTLFPIFPALFLTFIVLFLTYIDLFLTCLALFLTYLAPFPTFLVALFLTFLVALFLTFLVALFLTFLVALFLTFLVALFLTFLVALFLTFLVALFLIFQALFLTFLALFLTFLALYLTFLTLFLACLALLLTLTLMEIIMRSGKDVKEN
ncbi:unnamed protein product [Arctogadus glacialis]